MNLLKCQLFASDLKSGSFFLKKGLQDGQIVLKPTSLGGDRSLAGLGGCY